MNMTISPHSVVINSCPSCILKQIQFTYHNVIQWMLVSVSRGQNHYHEILFPAQTLSLLNLLTLTTWCGNSSREMRNSWTISHYLQGEKTLFIVIEIRFDHEGTSLWIGRYFSTSFHSLALLKKYRKKLKSS